MAKEITGKKVWSIPKEAARLNKLFNEEQKRFLVKLWMTSLTSRISHKLSDVPGAITIASSTLKTIFGADYKASLSTLIVIVDDSYRHTDTGIGSYTKAWAFTSKASALMEGWDFSALKEIKPGEKIYKEYPKVDRIKSLLEAPEAFKNKEHYSALKLYAALLNEDGSNTVVYRKIGKKGRRFSTSPSFQTLPRVIRKEIAEEDAGELDFENCHPRLFLALAEAEGVAAPTLKRIIEDREAFLAEICSHYGCDREDAKRLVLLTSYGASLTVSYEGQKNAYTAWLEDVSTSENGLTTDEAPASLVTLLKEMKIITAVALKREDAEYLSGISYKSRAVALYLQEMEDTALGLLETSLTSDGIEVSALQFDGLLVRNISAVTDEILKNAEDKINKEMKAQKNLNIQMKITKKG